MIIKTIHHENKNVVFRFVDLFILFPVNGTGLCFKITQ